MLNLNQIKWLLLIFLIFDSINSDAQAQFFTKQEKIIHSRLKKKDLTVYENKPLAYFLNDKLINYYSKWSYYEEPPGCLSGINFYYGKGNLYIRVYLKPLKYQKQFNKNMKWDFNKLKKETVEMVELIP